MYIVTVEGGAEKQMDSLAEAVRRNRSAEVAAAERREALAELHGGRTLRSGPYVSRSVGPERLMDPMLPMSNAELPPSAAALASTGPEYGGGGSAAGPLDRCASLAHNTACTHACTHACALVLVPVCTSTPAGAGCTQRPMLMMPRIPRHWRWSPFTMGGLLLVRSAESGLQAAAV